MKTKTACFTGHRTIPASDIPIIKERLFTVIEELIQDGVIYFGNGGALGFDTIAAFAVLELKEKYPQIKLIMVLPCPEQSDNWSEKDKKIYDFILEKSDKIIYTSKKHSSGCMHKRNRHLVDYSSFCVSYQIKNTGGTAYTVNYARQNGITVINISRSCLRF